MVLLAIRALITSVDITPQASTGLVDARALRPMCRRLLDIQDMDVAEACLKCLHLVSKVGGFLEGGNPAGADGKFCGIGRLCAWCGCDEDLSAAAVRLGLWCSGGVCSCRGGVLSFVSPCAI